ncbi:MAG: hypothetical protein Q7J25_01180 [Vicinamibacterales bacterium]|nr:hypothetical protein [Vicinamibacterales bacterium]
MHTASRPHEPVALARIRTILLGTLAAGLVGTLTELLLLGHFESAPQWIPLALLAIGIVVVTWHAARPSTLTVRALQVTMALCVAAGALGVGLHYDGNVEFELEITPAMGGLELVRKALTGATPVMAPGAMAMLGLIGLAHAYRHPCMTRD